MLFCLSLSRSVLRCKALPGADDLFGPQTPRRGPGLLVLVLGLDGVDTALGRDVHFDLEKTDKGKMDVTNTD